MSDDGGDAVSVKDAIDDCHALGPELPIVPAWPCDGTVKESTKFAQAPNMACCDGIFWRKKDNKIYVADMLINGVQAVDMQGKVTTIHKNGDTDGADGSLDQPCEVIVRGNELIVINMDMVFESDRLTNTTIDAPYTVSVIPLP